MDNKQKKKFYSLVYGTILGLIVVALCFNVYLSIKNLTQSTPNTWLDIAVIIVNALFLVGMLIDAYKTSKMQNKFSLAKFLYLIVFATILSVIILTMVTYSTKTILSIENMLTIGLTIASQAFGTIMFVLGLKLSKLYQNTTITLDSTSVTPNYNDELNLKKKLNELNRKLEMKKIQDQIEEAERELDNK